MVRSWNIIFLFIATSRLVVQNFGGTGRGRGGVEFPCDHAHDKSMDGSCVENVSLSS